MADYHSETEIPSGLDRDEAVKRKAAAFDAAFSHARTDPKMRVNLLLADCHRRGYSGNWLRKMLERESEETRALALRCRDDHGIIATMVRRAPDLAEPWQALLDDATADEESDS